MNASEKFERIQKNPHHLTNISTIHDNFDVFNSNLPSDAIIFKICILFYYISNFNDIETIF